MKSLTPPPELRKQWIEESPAMAIDGHTRVGTNWNNVIDKAAAWGARRSSLKWRALKALDKIQSDFDLGHLGQEIRDCLEAMPDG